MRIIIDESASFGVLGQTGRGLTEHFDIPVSWNCWRLIKTNVFYVESNKE